MVYGGVKCYALLSVFGLCWLSSTEFLVETSWDMDKRCLGFLSRRKKVCRVYWAIISTISCQFLLCHTVTLTFGVRTWKLTGLMHEVMPIYKPSFAEIRWKITEKMVYNWFEIAEEAFSILCPCDLNLWSADPKMYTALLHVIIYW